jgi:hypothetical protein
VGAVTISPTTIARAFEVPPQLIDPDADPRSCKVRSIGPLITMQWTPRLGDGPHETNRKGRARRWTFAWDSDWRPYRS